ncbi:MAG: hypothetical protein P8M34_11245 [Saprospiraceae bacterium]|nr:hypothetical protein [Saprospiraceae bacterium]|tara:strand:- start:4955 stop:5305 length:351 start_codon:yes stop_codon:yes gene_type:complete
MTLFIAFFSFFLTDMDNSTLISDHTGEWEYSVVSPDYTYKGVMELTIEGSEYAGLIMSEGTETELNDVKIDGNELTFNMTVQGFVCNVKGTFDGESFTGEVSVEGMALPMEAKKVG